LDNYIETEEEEIDDNEVVDCYVGDEEQDS
jgi:hypothetical protein